MDEISLEMAKKACPGIAREVTLEEFRAVGIAFLRAHNLIKKEEHCPNALRVED